MTTCPHFGTCGGCALQDMDAVQYAQAKRGAVMAALFGAKVNAEVLAPVIVPPRTRRRAAFKIRSMAEGLHIGFHAVRSHTVIDMHHCDILTPGLFALVAGLRRALEPVFQPGEAAELNVTETDTGFDASFRWQRRLVPGLVCELSTRLKDLGIARLTLNNERVFETAAPRVTEGGVAVTLPPGSFLQSTAEGEAALQAHVLAGVGKAKMVADLFAGVGTFSFPLARVAKVHAVEQDAPALAALVAAAKAPGLKPVTTEARDLFKRPLILAELKPYDALVLDPPRAGAQAQVRILAGAAIPRIVYVSCDAAGFARDAALLVAGGYKIGPVQPIDQFLWSSHIELVATFKRSR